MRSNPESRRVSDDFRKLLSGLAPQEREPSLRIKIVGLDLEIGDALAGASARGWDGVTGNGILPEVDFGELRLRAPDGVGGRRSERGRG